ncbi:hypothetical protein HN51_024511, partial [Arachis hypogaea]
EPPLGEAIWKKSKDNAPKMEAQIAKDVVPFNFLTPTRIIRDAILVVRSPTQVVVFEGANTMDVGRAVLVQTEPMTRLDAGTWGTIGVGFDYCIATALIGNFGFRFSTIEFEVYIPEPILIDALIF